MPPWAADLPKLPMWRSINPLEGTDMEPFVMPQSYDESGYPTLAPQRQYENWVRTKVQWPAAPAGTRNSVVRGMFSVLAPHMMDYSQFRYNVDNFLLESSGASLLLHGRVGDLERQVKSLQGELGEAQDAIGKLRKELMEARAEIIAARLEAAGANRSSGGGSSAHLPVDPHDIMRQAVAKAQASSVNRSKFPPSPLWTPGGEHRSPAHQSPAHRSPAWSRHSLAPSEVGDD